LGSPVKEQFVTDSEVNFTNPLIPPGRLAIGHIYISRLVSAVSKPMESGNTPLTPDDALRLKRVTRPEDRETPVHPELIGFVPQSAGPPQLLLMAISARESRMEYGLVNILLWLEIDKPG